MSFPSAVTRHAAGDNAEQALLYAFEHDTPLGYTAIMAVVEAARYHVPDPLAFVRERLGDRACDALRCESRGAGIWVNFDPNSKLGGQVARLLGTDVARPLMQQHAGMQLGYANCCGILASENPEDVRFTAHDQVHAQRTIDC